MNTITLFVFSVLCDLWAGRKDTPIALFSINDITLLVFSVLCDLWEGRKDTPSSLY